MIRERFSCYALLESVSENNEPPPRSKKQKNENKSQVTAAGLSLMRAGGFDVGNGIDYPSQKALTTVLAFRESKTTAEERRHRQEVRDDRRDDPGGAYDWPRWDPTAPEGSVS